MNEATTSRALPGGSPGAALVRAARSRAGIALLGAAAIASLSVICLNRHVPAIEADLGERARARLAESAIAWAALEISGRDLSVTGNAPDEVSRDLALGLLRDVRGVRLIEDLLSIAPPQAANPLANEDFSLRLLFDGQRLSMEGAVTDEAAADALVTLAGQRFTLSGVHEALDLDPNIPPDWQIAASAAIQALAALDSGEALLMPGQVQIAGRAADRRLQVRALQALARTLPERYAVFTDVRVAADEVATAAGGSVCQTQFDLLLDEFSVAFDLGSATIRAESRPLVDELARVAALCPRATIEIAGHTDDLGNRRDNLLLSQRRAEAVMSYLVDRGIELRRLIARGYGEGRPLEDNETEQGRARNRRIELLVQNTAP